MRSLPNIKVQEIPNTRHASSTTELRQFLLDDKKKFAELSGIWVRETARLGLDEILTAGNPKFYTIEVNGTTGDSGNQRRGFVPGNLNQARTSARAQFQSGIAAIANSLRPLLSTVIRQTFPRSSLQRLARDWVWYVQREALLKGKRTAMEALGGRVPDSIGIYDVLWLVPDAKFPADYAWFANYQAKRKVTSYNFIKKRSGHVKPRARRIGYLGEAARRMRVKRIPGVNIIATHIDTGATARYSRRLEKGRLPVFRISFVPGLLRPVTN